MSAATRPNVIVILADDIGYGDLCCYNADSRIPTPHCDALAAAGMRFTDAHSASAVCTPSRYALLTGRSCWRSALPRDVFFGYEPPLIEPDRPTLATLLSSAGYVSACIGKWHLGLDYAFSPGLRRQLPTQLPWPQATRAFEEQVDVHAGVGGGPVERGFDRFFGTSGCCTAQPPYAYIRDDHFVTAPTVYEDAPVFTSRPGLRAPDWDHSRVDVDFTEEAVAFIHEQADRTDPFFLYLASNSAHEPCTDACNPAFARGRSAAGPRGDMVWLFDWMVGRVRSALHETGQLENTLIVVTSDNGALPGDRIRAADGSVIWRDHAHRPNGDWRGWKAHIWEGGHREPLLISWPGRILAGSCCDALVGQQDLMATLAELVGLACPDAAEDSISFAPLLSDPAGPPTRQQIVCHSGWGVFALRDGAWKAIFHHQSSGGWPPPKGSGPHPEAAGQLYDLASDPGEQMNRWHEQPERVHAMRSLLLNHGLTPAMLAP